MFNKELEAQSLNLRAYDNYNNVMSKKNPTDGENAITHIGTAYYAVKLKAIDLPEGTVIQSPHGVDFVPRQFEQKCWHRTLDCSFSSKYCLMIV